jgi:hypothetical protein
MRALRLRREVEAILDGEVPPPPKPPRRDRADDQAGLFEK